MSNKNYFDIIIIGGGHAGIEAAIIGSKTGCKTLLITHNINKIGELSCNPAIGGIGKSQLVKEIDALDGIMGKNTDKSGIQFKILNTSKGKAVRSTRIQVDKLIYKKNIKKFLIKQNNLFIIQKEVKKLIIKNSNVIGIITNNNIKINSHITIITTGTFLNSKIHIGKKSYLGGRINDLYSLSLAKCLYKLPFKINRLKTGTPPRIDKKKINFKKLKIQYNDKNLPKFSFIENKKNKLKNLICHITYTNKKTHKIIYKNLHSSPMYTGIIKNIGPRYCPSIEDKIIRFNNKKNHQIFLEPESLNNNIIYPNGVSTSLPYKIQKNLINSIKGLENVRILKPGYAVEYDFLNPKDLNLTLESKLIKNLFLAGQINGTTGYEEAASQGIIAGLNATLIIKNKNNWIPKKNNSYIGVMINDLCNLGTNEPYRMFTSRVENRLLIREDNADLRLTKIGKKLGIINNERWIKFCIKKKQIKREYNYQRNNWINLNNFKINNINLKFKKKLINGEKLLKNPKINHIIFNKISYFKSPFNNNKIIEQIEIQIKYQGYIKKLKKNNNLNISLPKNIDYTKILNLSTEVISKLKKEKPKSIYEASCISGITSSAIYILLIWLKKLKK